MFIKFEVITPELEQKVEVLKSKLGFVVSSKVAEYCVDNYTDLDVRYQKSLEENKRLSDFIDSLIEALKTKNTAERELQILLGGKL